MSFEAVYCWERPVAEHPMLVPIVRLFLDEPGKSGKQAAREASERAGGPCERWALCDQPPNWKGHTYGQEFGKPYTPYGIDWGANKLNEWMLEAFTELRAIGWENPPEFMPIDWEGHYDPIDYQRPRAKVNGTIQAMAEVRARAIHYAVVDPAQQVWRSHIDASNYGDRPNISGDVDSNGWWFPPVGVQHIASPVAYVRRDRGQDEAVAATNLLVTLSRARENFVECVPWMADPRYVGDGLGLDENAPGKALFDIAEAGEVERLILWGERQGWAQLWLCDQYGGLT